MEPKSSASFVISQMSLAATRLKYSLMWLFFLWLLVQNVLISLLDMFT